MNACDTGYPQNVAFFGSACLNQRESLWSHCDSARRNCDAVGSGFGGHVDHVGLALSIKVGEGRHAVKMG